MPQPIVIEYNGLARGIEGAGNAIGNALSERNKEINKIKYEQEKLKEQRTYEEQETLKKRKALTPFNELLIQLSAKETPKLSISQAYQQAIEAGADPSEAAASAQMLMQQQTQNSYSSGMDAAMNFKGGIMSEEGRQAFVNNFVRSGGDLKSINELLKPGKKGAQSTYEKELDKFKAKSVIDTVQGGGDAQSISENLSWLEKNVDQVGKLRGYFNRGAMQSEMFAEYENKGNLVLAPVIKIFNKAGTLPTKKLEWIKEQFAISPHMTQDQIRGKINAMKPIVNIALDYHAQIANLVEKYGANIPNEEFFKVSKKLNNEFDNVYDKQFERKVYSDTSELDAKKLKGRIITNPTTGQKMISNGSEFVPYGG
jgi:hypothetical protein